MDVLDLLYQLFDVPTEYDFVNHVPVEQYQVYQAHWQNNWQPLLCHSAMFVFFGYFAVITIRAYFRDRRREQQDIAKFGESLEIGRPRWYLYVAAFHIMMMLVAMPGMYHWFRNVLIVIRWPFLG